MRTVFFAALKHNALNCYFKNFKAIILPPKQKCKRYFCQAANLVRFSYNISIKFVFFTFFGGILTDFMQNLILSPYILSFSCLKFAKEEKCFYFICHQITNSSQKFCFTIFLPIFLTKALLHTIIKLLCRYFIRRSFFYYYIVYMR